MFKKRMICVLLVCLLFFGVLPASVYGQQAKKIRVGFPQQEGLTQIGPDGELSGYTYEYLMEIAQYTGWDYEFVQVPGNINESLTKMLEMLEKGELDLLGGMLKNEQTEATYDFPGYNYGTGYTTLSVLEENADINETNYQSINPLRIGIIGKAATRIEQLKNFCNVNNMHPQLLPYDNEVPLLQALQNGEVDAILGNDLAKLDGTRAIAKFAPAPYFFATTKGNAEIISKLDFGILKVNESDPYFSAMLYEKYFDVHARGILLSEEEKNFLQNAPVIRVAVAPDKAPFQYLDAKTGELRGIAKEVFDKISQETGLRFTYIQAQSMKQLQEWTTTGQVDAVAAVPYVYTLADRFQLALTRPFVTAQTVMFVNRSLNAEELAGQTQAVSQEVWEESYEQDPSQNQGQSRLDCGTLEQCLRAVDSGQAGYGYGNSYSIEFYSRQPFFKNIKLVPQTGSEQRIGIGVVKPADVTLLSVLNKVLSSITESEQQAMIFQGTALPESRVTLAAWIDANPRLFTGIVVVVVLVVMGLLVLMLFLKLKASRSLAIANQRYVMLSEMAKEFLFEYDYKKDILTLSESCAQEFDCPTRIEHYLENLKRDHGEYGYKDAIGLLIEHNQEKKLTREYLLPVKGGGQRWFQIICAFLYEGAEPVYSIGKLVDIQEDKEERGLLLEKSQKDGLTDIYNATTTRERIVERLAAKPQEVTDALLIIDIDYFKEVNDLLGHYIGDEVLKGLADTLKCSFRQTDIIGRLGGDEFIVYVKNVPSSDFVREKCQMLCQNAKRTIRREEKSHTLSISIGAAKTAGAQTFDELYQKADSALYRVKNQGRDGFELS